MKLNDEKAFIDEIIDIYEFAMDTIDKCSIVLFRETRRKPFKSDWQTIKNRLPKIKEKIKAGLEDDGKELEEASLRGDSLKHKVEWLREARDLFLRMGSIDFLKKLLDRLNIILKSIISAIPGVGSGLTELKDIGEKEIDDTIEHVPVLSKSNNNTYRKVSF